MANSSKAENNPIKRDDSGEPEEYKPATERIDPGQSEGYKPTSERIDSGQSEGYKPTSKRFDVVIDTYLAKQQLAKEQAKEVVSTPTPRRRAKKASPPIVVDEDSVDEPDEE